MKNYTNCISVTVADVAAVDNVPATSNGGDWVIVFPADPAYAALVAAGHTPRDCDDTDRAMAAQGVTRYSARDL